MTTPSLAVAVLAVLLVSWGGVSALGLPQRLPSLGLPMLPPPGPPGPPGPHGVVPHGPHGPLGHHGPPDHDVHCHHGPDVLSPAKCAELCVEQGTDGGICVHGTCVCHAALANPTTPVYDSTDITTE